MAEQPPGLYFPSRLSEQVLAEKKKIMGSSLFSMQYQNEPIDEENATFRISQMRFYSVLPEEPLLYFLTVDPAGEPKDTSDFSAFVLNAVNAAGVWRIVLAEAIRLDPDGIINHLFDICEKWTVAKVGIEADVFQRMLVWGVKRKAESTGKHIPITPLKSGGIHKETRIKGLQPRFENSMIEFLEEHQFGIIDDLLRFPKAEHDDLPDALGYQEQIAYAPRLREKAEYTDMSAEAREKRFIESLDRRKFVDDVLGSDW